MFENELQQALLVVALVVIAGIYFYGKAKAKAANKNLSTKQDVQQKVQPSEQTSAEISEITPTQKEEIIISESSNLSEQPETPELETALVEEKPQETPETAPDAILEESILEPHKLDKDHPLYVPETQGKLPLDDFILQAPPSSVEDVIEVKTQDDTAQKTSDKSKKQEQKTYAILVLSPTEDLTIYEVVKELEALQLTENSKGFYEKVEKGEQIFMVANALEPGTFREETGANIVTQGVILILNLPNPVVPAPRAMGDLIDMSRRLAQRLNGKMYSVQRQQMRETDLQSMREAALDYESTKLANK